LSADHARIGRLFFVGFVCIRIACGALGGIFCFDARRDGGRFCIDLVGFVVEKFDLIGVRFVAVCFGTLTATTTAAATATTTSAALAFCQGLTLAIRRGCSGLIFDDRGQILFVYCYGIL
jgi:hypothetical protein